MSQQKRTRRTSEIQPQDALRVEAPKGLAFIDRLNWPNLRSFHRQENLPSPMSESKNATCRKEFCDEPPMQRGNYDPNMVSAMDSIHHTTTDWELCHKCNYWLQQTGKPGLIYQWDGETDWRHSIVGPEDSPMKGSFGRKHLITVIKHDANHPDSIGETLETTNLWLQGIIPKEYHKAMENAPNKIFVTIKELR